MCDPKPGARCSYDTAKELADAVVKLERARRELDRDPSDAAAIRRRDKAVENLSSKQAAYDSAPRGQRELAAAIRASADPGAQAVDQLRTRLAVGRQTRVDQKRALARSQGKPVAAEHLEADKALSRLRHPEGILLEATLDRYDTVGFFVPPASAGISLSSLRPAVVLDAISSTAGTPGEYLGAWASGGSVVLGPTRKFATAESARRFADESGAATFFDAQLGTPAGGGAGTSLRYLAAPTLASQLESATSAIAAVHSLNGHAPDDDEVASLLQLVGLAPSDSLIAAARANGPRR